MKKYIFSIFIFLQPIIAFSQKYTKYTDVSLGCQFGMALRSDSTIWVWGFNGNGQLGTGITTALLAAPTQVDTFSKWIYCAAGGFHRLVINRDSTLWGCGLNGNGQLGVATPGANADTLIQISKDHWRMVVATVASSCGIKSDGTLWVWGDNFYGLLGKGDTTTRSGLIQIGSSNDWIAVALNFTHVLALKKNGTLWSWGDNTYGELGHGNTILSPSNYTPTQVNNDSDWSQIAVGFGYSIAEKTNGTLWSWGINDYNQLGRPAGGIDSTITEINTDTTWKLVKSGGTFAFGIKNNGTLWGWGSNANGQLGLPASTSVSMPTIIGSDTSWALIAASVGYEDIYDQPFGTNAAGCKTPLNVICTTGANVEGELGNGTTGPYQDYFSCTTGEIATFVNNTFTINNFNIYPNPANQYLIIQSPQNLINQAAEVWIYNSIGTAVLHKNIALKNETNIDIAGLTPGLYTISLSYMTGRYTAKWIKN